MPWSFGSRMRAQWVWLLLLELLSMFWSTMMLLEVPDWSFISFLFILIGPILLFFAASSLIASESHDDAGEASGPDFSHRFFYMLAAVEAWLVTVDLTIGPGFSASTVGNVLVGLVVLCMAIRPTARVWVFGTALTWLLVLASLVREGAGILT